MTDTEKLFAENKRLDERIKIRSRQIHDGLRKITEQLQGASARLDSVKERLAKREAYLERVLAEPWKEATMNWLGQGPYADCQIVAMCNALRWYGLPSPAHPGARWEELIDLSGARHGPVISTERLAEHLGLSMSEVAIEDRPVPAMLGCWNPEVGSAVHCILVIDWRGDQPTVVNYRGEAGPLVETLVLSNEDAPPRDQRWTKIYLPKPGNVNRKAHWLAPANKEEHYRQRNLMERAAGIRWAADAFEADARVCPRGATFSSGPLYQASIYNVNMRAARKLRELADALESGRLGKS